MICFFSFLWIWFCEICRNSVANELHESRINVFVPFVIKIWNYVHFCVKCQLHSWKCTELREEEIRLEQLSLDAEHQQHQLNNSNLINQNNNISVIKNNNINSSKHKPQQHQLNLTKNNLNNTIIVNNNNSRNKLSFGQTNHNSSNNSNVVNDSDLRLQVKNYLRNVKLSPAKVAGQISKPLQLTAMNNTSTALASKNRSILNRTLNGTSTPRRLRNATSGSKNIASKLNATFPSVKTPTMATTGKWLPFSLSSKLQFDTNSN